MEEEYGEDQIYIFVKNCLSQKEEVNAFKNLGTGNRIATMLFYVSTCLLSRLFDISSISYITGDWSKKREELTND